MEENRRCLQSRGTVVFLDTSIELQLRRTQKDKSRPLLQGDDPEAMLRQLKQERHPLYKEIADINVFVGDSGSKRTVTQIMDRLARDGLIRV